MRSLLFIILLIGSCTSHNQVKKNKNEIIWDILDNAVIQKWNDANIIENIGQPLKKYSKKSYETWYYESLETSLQEWSIEISNKMIKGIIYFPSSSRGNDFTLVKVLKHWKNLNCKQKKSDLYRRGHTYYQDNYYLCDDNKKIDINKYNEITSIRVN